MTDPQRLTALALQDGERQRLLLANHTSETLTISVDGVYQQRVLSSDSAPHALSSPARFRTVRTPCHMPLTLPPYAYICLDREKPA